MFTGTYTAVVTPFNRNGQVDFGRLKALIERQIAGGVDGVVPVGTTGESPTLEYDEHHRVIEETAAAARGRIKVIAGTGANSTSEAVMLTRQVQSLGVDGTLQVVPYYNKPSQEGLYRHFSTVADLGLPVVLYNVPGRTSRELAVDTIARLAGHERIVAIKEAGGSVERVSAILDACDITVLSGDDMLTLPMMSVGAQGIISVASNVAPELVVELVRAATRGDMAAAGCLHARLYRLFRDLFIDTNPVPVKCALAMLGQIEEVYRLPLCEPSEKVRQQLRQTLQELQLL
ncbi:MAG: 4-hydroxy-tetrahydrodipicolinate synthase [Kiritimatiellae bacterium]|nr:4-hydroxy-tetrahydrodipicolinate synthase [Kiritimatiellia bacterium]